MFPGTSILIETAGVTSDNLDGFLSMLQGCWKCSSLLWMQSNGFPVLPGLILNAWSPEAKAAISRFGMEKNFSELLVRIEKPGQRWTRRRGGYTIPLGEAQCQVEELAHEGMITILLEPASPYLDRFSLTSLCDFETGKVDVEVVGSGFDASDVLRADSLPHERFELLFTKENQAASPFPTKRTHIVGSKEYQASVRRRLVKIGAKLRNPAFPDEVLSTLSRSELRSLAEEATRFLQSSGQTALLDHPREYAPIPAQLLDMFLQELQRLLRRVRSETIGWRTLSLAASFLPQNRLVIWDFFPPGEHDTRALV